MNQKITYIIKCEMCGGLIENIVRDENINEILTNSDIYTMMANHANDPYELNWCDECGMTTLFKRIAWRGVESENLKRSMKNMDIYITNYHAFSHWMEFRKNAKNADQIFFDDFSIIKPPVNNFK